MAERLTSGEQPQEIQIYLLDLVSGCLTWDRIVSMLEMRAECERCRIPLTDEGAAWICSYECTFCDPCSDVLAKTCPNCSGELVRRPRRFAQSSI